MGKRHFVHQPVIAKKAQAEFLKKLSSLLNEGFSLPDAVVVLSPFYMNREMQTKILTHFEEGHNLSHVFHEMSYPDTVVESVRLAEVHGHLTEVLAQTAALLERQNAMKRQAIKTLSYPLGLLGFMTILFIGFKIYFLPLFVPLVERSNPEAVGRIELIFSLPFYMILFAFVAMCFVWGYFYLLERTKSIPWLLFSRKLAVVLVVQNHLITWHISKELSLLLSGGVNLQDSLRFIQLGNHQLRQMACSELLKWLERGEDFSSAVKMNEWMSKDVVKFIEHSELHGYLSEELALYQQSKADALQKRLELGIVIVQPVLFLVIGGLVVSAYLSIMLPIYNLISI